MLSILPSNKSGGFTIIELTATLAILTFGIIVIYEAFFPFIALTFNNSLRFTASYLAQEGVEIVRNMRDRNFIARILDPLVPWSAGLTACSLGCQVDYNDLTLSVYNPTEFLKIGSSGFYSYDAGTDSKFKRKITLDLQGSDVLRVDVSVTWDYNGQPYSFETREYLYNWY